MKTFRPFLLFVVLAIFTGIVRCQVQTVQVAGSTKDLSSPAAGFNLPNAATITFKSGSALTALGGSTIDLSSGTVSLPSTFVTLTGSQTLTNKTLTAPLIASIVNGGGTLTLPTLTDTLIGRATTDTLTNKTLSSSTSVISSITFSAGVKQTFAPNSTNAGLNVGSTATDPSSLANGDLWYDSTNNLLKARISGSSVSLSTGGGGGTVNNGTANQVTYYGATGTTVSGTPTLTVDASTTSVGIQPTARTSGVTPYLTVTAPADTAQTAGTESPGVSFTGATRQHASNTSITSQRETIFAAPTYSFATATGTITNAATVAITAAPIVGTNAAITNPYALWLQSGNIGLGASGSIASIAQSSGGLTIAAAGTNQNVNIDPIGTGVADVTKDFLVTDSTSARTWQGNAGLLGRGIFVQRAGGNTGVNIMPVGSSDVTFEGNPVSGSYGSLTATGSGRSLFILLRTYGGSTWIGSASIGITTTQTQSESARGSEITFNTSLNNTVGPAALAAKVGNDGSFHSYGTTDATSSTAAGVLFDGGLGVAKKLYVGSTGTATTTTTGSFVNGGGLGNGGAIYAGTEIKSVSPTAGIGYGTGAGGTVTQATSKVTGVTLNKVSGQITMNNASLANATAVAFTLTDSAIATTDVVTVSIASGGTVGAYLVAVGATGSGTCSITLYNCSGGALGEAVVINFAVIKAVTS